MPRFKKQFDNNLSGVLFQNDRKQTDAHPDMKGQVEIEGQVYWVSGWYQQHSARGEYLKLKLTPKESDDRSPQQRNNERVQQRGPQHGGQRGGYQQQNRGYQNNNDIDDDDINF